MYEGKNKASSVSNYDIANFVEGTDIFNSKLIHSICKNRLKYPIEERTKKDIRPDLFLHNHKVNNQEYSLLILANGIFDWYKDTQTNIHVPNTEDL